MTLHSAHTNQTVEFDQLTSFHFPNKSTVVKYGPIWTGNIKLVLQSNTIQIQQGHVNFIVEKFNIASIIINENHKFLEIFFCLRKPPKHTINNINGINGSLHPFDYTNRTFNLSLKRLLPFENMKLLRSILTGVTLEIFHVVNIEEIAGSTLILADPMNSIADFEKFCLIRQWHSANASTLPPTLPEIIVKKLASIQSNQLLEYVLANIEPVPFQDFKLPDVKQLLAIKLEEDLPSSDSGYRRVASVRITPSRIIFLPMQTVPQNRVFRYFPVRENFVLVDFATEYDDENPWRSDTVTQHFQEILWNGFKIAGINYTFLGCSNSQLREGRCWFSCLNRQEVYDKIGDFSKITNSGRKLTRLGLAFASSIETVEVDPKHIHNVEDDIKNERGTCFSDGIGKASIEYFRKISTEYFRKISYKVKLHSAPSAFQIRYGGVKGVISCFYQEDDLVIRKSMKKFESEHNMIEVLNIARPIPLYLNRHVILLLSSYGIADEVFLDMQQADLNNFLNILTTTDESKIVDFVKSKSTTVDWEKFPTKVTNEPIFRQILMYQIIDLVSELANHSKISVKKGRVLMGVMDETGTLNYGEIYANIVDDEMDMILDEEVIVFR